MTGPEFVGLTVAALVGTGLIKCLTGFQQIGGEAPDNYDDIYDPVANPGGTIGAPDVNVGPGPDGMFGTSDDVPAPSNGVPDSTPVIDPMVDPTMPLGPVAPVVDPMVDPSAPVDGSPGSAEPGEPPGSGGPSITTGSGGTQVSTGTNGITITQRPTEMTDEAPKEVWGPGSGQPITVSINIGRDESAVDTDTVEETQEKSEEVDDVDQEYLADSRLNMTIFYVLLAVSGFMLGIFLGRMFFGRA